jgi:hypothetical protein
VQRGKRQVQQYGTLAILAGKDDDFINAAAFASAYLFDMPQTFYCGAPLGSESCTRCEPKNFRPLCPHFARKKLCLERQ